MNCLHPPIINLQYKTLTFEKETIIWEHGVCGVTEHRVFSGVPVHLLFNSIAVSLHQLFETIQERSLQLHQAYLASPPVDMCQNILCRCR